MKENKCPVCLSNENIHRIKEGENYGCPKYIKFLIDNLRSEEYSFYYCTLCDLIYSYPFTNPGSKYYENEMIDYKVGRLLDLIKESWQQNEYFKYSPSKNGKILDVGCNIGKFLFRAKKSGYDTYGLDFDKKALAIARKKYGLENLYNTSVENIKDVVEHKFDVVTFFEVLEHLDDVRKFIYDIGNILKPEGYICFSVPNRERSIPVFLELDLPPHHLTHWNVAAIRNILEINNFEIIVLKNKLKIDDVSLFFSIMTSIGLVKKEISKIDEKESKNVTKMKLLSLAARIKSKIMFFIAFILFPIFRIIYSKGFTIFVLAKKKNRND